MAPLSFRVQIRDEILELVDVDRISSYECSYGSSYGALFGGPFAKLTKLVGLAQKCGLSGVALKAVKLVAEGTKFFINMIIKPMSRKSGESWFTAVKRLFS